LTILFNDLVKNRNAETVFFQHPDAQVEKVQIWQLAIEHVQPDIGSGDQVQVGTRTGFW